MIGKLIVVVALMAKVFQILGYNEINTYAGVQSLSGSTAGDGGPVTSAKFNAPFASWVSSTGNVYQGEDSGKRIRKISAAGIINAYFGTGVSTLAGNGGAATAATGSPWTVWGDSVGSIYFADNSGSVIRKIGSNNIVNAFAGGGPLTTESAAATQASFSGIYTAFGDSLGNIYAICQGQYKIKKISTSLLVTTFAGTGSGAATDSSTAAGIGGKATAARFYQPRGGFMDSSLNIYITSNGGGYIRKIVLSTSIVTLVAGTPGSQGYTGDMGPATAALLQDGTTNVATDTAGNVYYSSLTYNNLRYVDINGIIGPYAGKAGTSTTGGYSGDGGAATAALMKGVYGMTCSAGLVYVSELSNNIVRSITVASDPVSIEFAGFTTVEPTIVPSKIPTAGPSIKPTAGPTAPSVLPTIAPTGGSAAPSVAPTQAPTALPTTIAPSVMPSVTPTLVPSVVPTLTPTVKPSVLPSVCPSTMPSVLPSLAPSVMPTPSTSAPSIVPTVTPSVGPTQAPTTTMPSVAPTVTPTIVPTTTQPTVAPSVVPTLAPTEVPTVNPTIIPSVVPTVVPTNEPTVVPTIVPSEVPTVTPTALPTVQPTVAPSNSPSVVPTIMPTVVPTIKPTVIPTVAPSVAPTVIPSLSPSVRPTTEPSAAPSVRPTAPTKAPTKLPTVKPTRASLVTPAPSHLPTAAPTEAIAISFDSNIYLHNVTATVLGETEQSAVAGAVAETLSLNSDQVTFLSQEYIGIEGQPRLRRLTGGGLPSYQILVSVNVWASTRDFEDTTNQNASYLYNRLTTTLTTAVANNAFTATVRSVSAEMNALNTLYVGHVNLTVTDYSVITASDHHHRFGQLSAGDFAGIVIGVLMAAILVIAGCYYMVILAAEKQSEDHTEIPAAAPANIEK